MKIIYVANFDAGLADDEGSICHAFRELGHTVEVCREKIGYRAVNLLHQSPDLLLFHKWDDVNTLRQFEGVCPRAFWWFDLVDWPADPTLAARCENRKAWMTRVTPHVEFGFLSDGDWAAKDRKYHFLPQGADGRIAGRGVPKCPCCTREGWDVPLLFTGISRGGGRGREGFVEEMRRVYGPGFVHVPGGVYREQLRDHVAAARIVVCPDSPVTDRYASNRIWNACGFGAFVLHPACAFAARHYEPGWEVHYYENRTHLHELIGRFLERPEERRAVGEAALRRTLVGNLYRHRCEELLRIVKGT